MVLPRLLLALALLASLTSGCVLPAEPSSSPSHPTTSTTSPTTIAPTSTSPPLAQGSSHSYDIPSTGERVCTGTATDARYDYQLRVTGLFDYATDGRQEDAGYVFHSASFGGQPGKVEVGGQAGFLLDGIHPDPGALRNNHTYDLRTPGTGAVFCFRIGDDTYGDNSGHLTVAVRA